MVIYDARPSSFTQLVTTSDWEALHSAIGGFSSIDFSAGSAFASSFDVPGRNIVIADGNIVIKGQLWRCDAPVSTAIPGASAQNRIDRLVLRLNRGASTSATVIQPVVITGTPSGSPVEPPLVQTPTGIWDYPICSWTATSAGALSGLTDERYTGGQASNGPFAFTPSITGAGSLTLSTAVGYYYLMGDLVFVNAYLVVNAAGTGAGPISLVGPPINPFRGSARQFIQGSAEAGGSGINGACQAVAFSSGSANVWDRIRSSTGANVAGTDLQNGTLMIFAGAYRRA